MYQVISSNNAALSGPTSSSWCRVPKRRAAARAWSDSSNGRSAKPTESVSTGRARNRDIVATIALESTPPLRNAPTGTSLTRWRRTVSSRISRSLSSNQDGACERSGRILNDQ